MSAAALTSVRSPGFDQVADLFGTAHVAALRPQSRATYRAALKRLRAAFGRKRITAITKIDVRAFVAAERAEGLKANTVAQHLNVLRTLYGFARDDLEIPVMIPRLKPSERPDPADDAREHRILADDELADVLDALPDRARLFFRTVAETGARKSEVLGLTARRIGKDTITFAEQLGRGGKLVPLKTRQSKRTIEIPRSLAAELRLASGPEPIFGWMTHSASNPSGAAPWNGQGWPTHCR